MTYSITLYFSDDDFQKIVKKYSDVRKFRKKLKEKALELIE